ncbi:MAG: nitrate ABC transporter ATP-binding protein [Candidatus Hecatellales archaeon]|nr:MAG: nitrate ABC transporter ATP-binding protein [Candidatus Hecatellales archaeon]
MKYKVEVEKVSKFFVNPNGERLQVLDNISFKVYDGEFLCFVGPSGCGKTTLLRIIAGLEKPSSGRVRVEGETPNPKKIRIGFVFQEEALFPWRNVWDNIKFGLEVRGNYNPKIVEDVVRLVGLENFKSYYPHQLSGGMRKRVAIARALAVNPSIILMDEPFGDLDAQTRWIMHKELYSIHEKLKKTTILVTHNVEEAVYLADRVLVLTRRPAKVKKEIFIGLERPRNKLSSQFIRFREEIIGFLREEVPEI